jgi:hypothetical protein
LTLSLPVESKVPMSRKRGETRGTLQFFAALRLDGSGCPHQTYAAAMRRIRSSCSCLLSAPMVKASRIPSDSANLMPSS